MLSLQALASGSRFWRLPVDASAHGPALDQHLLLNLWIVLALFGLLHILLAAGLMRRRRRTPPRRQGWVEFLPLTAFALLFAFLAARAEGLWAAARYTGASATALQVEVTGMQFAWYFRYGGPDAIFGATRPELADAAAGNPLGMDRTDMHATDDIVSSQLVLPAGREVDLRLRAQDVIHGFSVPEMRLKQNAVPGQTLHIHFTPQTPGEYAILCTQLCGMGHYRMAATMRVVTPPEFAQWLQQHEATVEAKP